MTHLTTDWLCIATEGDTVDERQIYREWIVDMGETYDINHYGALIWPEHSRDWGNFGAVREVMWQEGEDKLARLYAKISPNMNLIYSNREGQLVYFSIEAEENWRGTGRTYLKGLAVTDSPASVGTTRLRFSQRNLSKQGYYACVMTDDGKITQEENMKTPWQNLFGIKPKSQKFEEVPEEEKPSDEDKLTVIANALNDLEARVEAIESQLDQTAGEVETIKDVVDTEDFADLRANIGNIVKNFSKLDNKVTQLPKRQFGDKQKKSGFKFL